MYSRPIASAWACTLCPFFVVELFLKGMMTIVLDDGEELKMVSYTYVHNHQVMDTCSICFIYSK